MIAPLVQRWGRFRALFVPFWLYQVTHRARGQPLAVAFAAMLVFILLCLQAPEPPAGLPRQKRREQWKYALIVQILVDALELTLLLLLVGMHIDSRSLGFAMQHRLAMVPLLMLYLTIAHAGVRDAIAAPVPPEARPHPVSIGILAIMFPAVSSVLVFNDADSGERARARQYLAYAVRLALCMALARFPERAAKHVAWTGGFVFASLLLMHTWRLMIMTATQKLESRWRRRRRRREPRP